MILPTSADFFFLRNSTHRVPEERISDLNEDFSKGNPLPFLVLNGILKFMSLLERKRLVHHSRSYQLKKANEATPYRLETCVIGSNIIEFDFFASSWTFCGGNKVIKVSLGGLREELKLAITQDEAMLRILMHHLNRRGSDIKKLFLMDKKAVNLLRALEFQKKFEITNEKGLKLEELIEKLGEVKETELGKMEWTLVDQRNQYH